MRVKWPPNNLRRKTIETDERRGPMETDDFNVEIRYRKLRRLGHIQRTRSGSLCGDKRNEI